jgi:hypothetical protein
LIRERERRREFERAMKSHGRQRVSGGPSVVVPAPPRAPVGPISRPPPVIETNYIT